MAGKIRQTELHNDVNTKINKTDKIGDLTTLTTTNKNSLVAALNETVTQLAQTVKTINGVAPDENGNVEVAGGGTGIDDSSISIEKTWSSSKIKEEIEKKSPFMDIISVNLPYTVPNNAVTNIPIDIEMKGSSSYDSDYIHAQGDININDETIYFSPELKGIPNGATDIVFSENGVFKKEINVAELTITDEMITTIITTRTNFEVIFINKPTDSFMYNKITEDIDNSVIFENLETITGTTGVYDNISNVGKVSYRDSGTAFKYLVPKGTTIEQAKDMLRGRKLLYQLADPIIEELHQESILVQISDVITLTTADGKLTPDTIIKVAVTSSVEPNLYVPPLKVITPKKYEFKPYGLGGWQGICFVNNELWVFTAGADDHSTNGSIFRLNKDTLEVVTVVLHNLGHCNSVDYCEETDTIIMGNGSSNYNLLGQIYIFPNVSDWIGQPQLDFDTIEKIVIDVSSLDEPKVNCCWGDTNNGQYNIFYMITDDNKIIRKCLLGKGENDMGEFGSLIAEKSEDEFNGTFKVLTTYTQEDGFDVNQGMYFENGNMYTANGHYDAVVMKFEFNDNNSITPTKIHIPMWKVDGIRQDVFSQGLTIKDGKIWHGINGVGMNGFLVYDII